jgi:LPXTG-motif cell wall-anchored protein
MRKLWLSDTESEPAIDTETSLMETAESDTAVGNEPTSEEKVLEQQKEETAVQPSDEDETAEVKVEEDETASEEPVQQAQDIAETGYGIDARQVGMIAAGVALLGALAYFLFMKKK